MPTLRRIDVPDAHIIDCKSDFHSETERVGIPVSISRECKPDCKQNKAWTNASDGSGKLLFGSILVRILLDLIKNLRA